MAPQVWHVFLLSSSIWSPEVTWINPLRKRTNVPWEGTIVKRNETFSNHRFSGDILVFRVVSIRQLFECNILMNHISTIRYFLWMNECIVSSSLMFFSRLVFTHSCCYCAKWWIMREDVCCSMFKVFWSQNVDLGAFWWTSAVCSKSVAAEHFTWKSDWVMRCRETTKI